MKLTQLGIGESGIIRKVAGERAFRRRILELGLLPGTHVVVQRVAPLGDPIELWSRGGKLSIRAKEALGIEVEVAERPSA